MCKIHELMWLLWVCQYVSNANGLFQRFWHYAVGQEDGNNFFCMTLGRWGGHFLFGWVVCSHQWLWDWAWCTSNKVRSFLFFCSRPHIWSFSVISAKLPSFHTLDHLLTEKLSVHMIINCYLGCICFYSKWNPKNILHHGACLGWPENSVKRKMISVDRKISSLEGCICFGWKQF